MKRLLRNIKNNAWFSAAIFSIAFAQSGQTVTEKIETKKSVAVIVSVTGKGFVQLDEQLVMARVGQEITDFSSILVEDGGQVTVADYYDHLFHISGSGHIKFLNRVIELKSGYLWLQSYREGDSFSIQTANGIADYQKGEAIFSYNPSTGKTQVLTIAGKFKLANILDPEIFEEVAPGYFSFVEKNYENGRPRLPTAIGEKSFQKVTGLFYDVKPMASGSTRFQVATKNSQLHSSELPKRSIASKNPTDIEKGNWSFDNSDAENFIQNGQGKETNGNAINSKNSDSEYMIIRQPPSVTRVPSEFNKKDFFDKQIRDLKFKERQRNPRVYDKKTNVSIHIFGIKKNGAVEDPKPAADIEEIQKVPKSDNTESLRVPASTKNEKISKQPIVITPISEFEGSATDQLKQQMRHDDEVNSLINDLKSYEMDYKKNY